MCSFVCPTGGKQSMSSTLLPRAIGRGLRLLAETRVTRLRIKHRRVTAAQAEARGPDGRRLRLTLRAPLVFVCAGAVHTPALLRRSGLTAHIGDTLRLHPTMKCTALFPETVNAERFRLPLVAITEFAPAQRIGGSVFSPAIFALGLAEDWEKRRHLMQLRDRCGIYYAMIRPRGIGSVRPLPIGTEPLVRYRLANADWAALGTATSRLAEAMFAAGAQHVYPSITGHDGWTDAAQARAALAAPLPQGRCSLMTIHLFGSCPPGEDATRCATDSFGRVRGVENLILADASQIPEAPGVNPQATIMALALRAAEAALANGARANAHAAFREAAAA
jgi:choline dehydrogenase-like flavoprotein